MTLSLSSTRSKTPTNEYAPLCNISQYAPDEKSSAQSYASQGLIPAIVLICKPKENSVIFNANCSPVASTAALSKSKPFSYPSKPPTQAPVTFQLLSVLKSVPS